MTTFAREELTVDTLVEVLLVAGFVVATLVPTYFKKWRPELDDALVSAWKNW